MKDYLLNIKQLVRQIEQKGSRRHNQCLYSECFKPTGWFSLCKCSHRGHFQATGAKLVNMELGRDVHSLFSGAQMSRLHHTTGS